MTTRYFIHQDGRVGLSNILRVVVRQPYRESHWRWIQSVRQAEVVGFVNPLSEQDIYNINRPGRYAEVDPQCLDKVLDIMLGEQKEFYSGERLLDIPEIESSILPSGSPFLPRFPLPKPPPTNHKIGVPKGRLP